MSEETPTSTEQSPVTTTTTTTPSSIGLKDLLVPISIVIAGVCIGIGLYFSGSSPQSGNLLGADNVPVQNESPENALQNLVTAAGVSISDVEACVNEGDVAALVQEDVDNAIETGGTGTPWSIVIGPDGKTYPVNGAVPIAAIEQVLELARAGAAAPASDRPTNTDLVTPVTENDHIKGSVDAPIKVVEYSDFDCPFCGRFHDSMNQIVTENDDVAWVYRHFPLDQLHPNARTIAQISECVAELGGTDAFWTFTDGYFAL